MIDGKAERDAQRTENNRDELIDLITRATFEDGDVEVLPGLTINRSSKPTEPLYLVARPVFCVIAQGSKEVILGEEVFRYDSGKYLISTFFLIRCLSNMESRERRMNRRIKISDGATRHFSLSETICSISVNKMNRAFC